MSPNRSFRSGPQSHPLRQSLTIFTTVVLMLMAFATSAYAHDVTPGDAGYIQEIFGVHIISFIYLGENCF